VGKFLGIGCALLVLALGACFVLTVAALVVNERSGVATAEKAVFGLLVGDTLIFGIAFVLFAIAGRRVRGAARYVPLAAFAVTSLLLVVGLALGTMLGFNR
jgi:hypothetical protein